MSSLSDQAALIRVKFVTKAQAPGESAEQWLRRFPGGIPRWGRCVFDFDPESRNYDWLVVYDDLPRQLGGDSRHRDELLACPRERTLLITTEPSSVKAYGRAYVQQFGHVLTSQEPWALRHPRAIHYQTGLIWFYGMQSPHGTYDAMVRADTPPAKPALIATVCSSKRMGHTLHAARYDFTQALKARMPELEVFGHGVRPIVDKAEAVDPFSYHIAVENHVAEHHWTEKLADPFLGYSLPFYFGAPNTADYFPPESFIPINIFDVEGTERVIREAIANNEYAKRLPAIIEARKLVLENFGTFPNIARIIQERTAAQFSAADRSVNDEHLLARHAIRRRRPISAMLDLCDKVRHRLRGPQTGL